MDGNLRFARHSSSSLTVARHFVRIVPTVVHTIAPVLDGHTALVGAVQVAFLTLAAVCNTKQVSA